MPWGVLKKIIGRDVLLNLESHPSLTSLKEVGGRLEFASNWEQIQELNWGKYQNEIWDKYQMFNIKYITSTNENWGQISK